MVGNPWTPYFSESSRLRSGLGTFALASSPSGKSSFTRTNDLAAAVRNSACSKTSLSNRMHQPHQSDPVKSTKRSFLASLAATTAWSKSVIQTGDAGFSS